MQFQATGDEGWTQAEAACLGRNMPGRALRSHGADSAAHRRHDVLTRAVEDEVIPRLLRIRRPQFGAALEPQSPPGQEAVARLVGLLLAGGHAEPAAFVEAIRDAGTPGEDLLLELLAPAARRLGEMWEDDTCTFSDVTLGMLRLGAILRQLGHAAAHDIAPRAAAPSALLVQMPGEQHGFGLAMVVQFFRNAGWDIRQAPAVTSGGLAGLVRAHWFGVVGISVSCDDRLETLEADIRAIRRHSRNRGVGILVGGPPFVAHPQLAAMVGADATAADGREAVRQAHGLLATGR